MGGKDRSEENTATARGVVVSSYGEHLSPLLVVIHGQGLDLGQRFELNEAGSVIGRHSSADVRLDVDSMSRNHAMIYCSDGDWHIEDLASTNGVRVNDVEVIDTSVLADGDIIRLGDVILKFLSGGDIEASYQDTIYRLSSYDTLTGCYNRRYFNEFLERELIRAGRAGTSTGVVLLDVDGFKEISDYYGNIAGDDVLCEIARRIRTRVRRDDVVARYGGAQFSFVLANADAEGTRRFATEVCELVAARSMTCAHAEIEVTVSAGVAIANSGARTDAATLVEIAAQDLASAQRNQA